MARGLTAVCGFVGGTDPAWNYSAALASLTHRGPDAGQLDLEGPVKVGFRRLSIIDLRPAANQPMFAADGATWIVFNGEIYGYRDLRAELVKRGHAFRTDSDTEVLLNAYLAWGDDFVTYVDGMFAIAIWDPRAGQLKLYRDRPGIKPLYYFYDGRRFAFASELKALERALGSDELVVDETACYDFLSYRYVPAPKTLYRNCYKLPPAHRLRFTPATGTLEAPRPFWTLPVPEQPARPPLDACCEELRSLIATSVDEQMIADVPLGFFLSGGVDSSVVVAAAARNGRSVETFSIGFDRDEVSETPYAREVATRFGTQHHERILSPENAQELLPRLKEWFDEPFADESALPTYLVAKTARERVTVVLTGDGGDEVFGGYRTYPRYARYAAWPKWPAAFERASHALRRGLPRRHAVSRALVLLETAFSDGPNLWGRLMGGLSTPEKGLYARQLGIPRDYDDWWHYRQFWREDLPLRTRLQYVDFHTFMPGFVLTKVDRTTMAVSLEARVPLLARRIVEFSFSLHEDLRYYRGEPKGLLRHAYRGILPDHILDRRKKGFGIPRYYLKDVSGGRAIQEHVLRSLYLREPGSRSPA
ncbi:MAG TPA: asparagine synthase (glutamine-hydrolyzing) [Gammaproteobacteria bacterium]|nr:asparagine synthase (glutamine-hydrolyzing) [Gammaproteobacteria bacterium]